MGIWEIAPRLFLADAAGAKNQAALDSRGIEAVINLAGAAFDTLYPELSNSSGDAPPSKSTSKPKAAAPVKQRHYLNVRIDDAVDEVLPLAATTAFLATHYVDHGRVCMVHCRGAHSRSPAVIIGFLSSPMWVSDAVATSAGPDVLGEPRARPVSQHPVAARLGLKDGVLLIKQGRGLCNVNTEFLEQLAAWADQPSL